MSAGVPISEKALLAKALYRKGHNSNLLMKQTVRLGGYEIPSRRHSTPQPELNI